GLRRKGQSLQAGGAELLCPLGSDFRSGLPPAWTRRSTTPERGTGGVRPVRRGYASTLCLSAHLLCTFVLRSARNIFERSRLRPARAGGLLGLLVRADRGAIRRKHRCR